MEHGVAGLNEAWRSNVVIELNFKETQQHFITGSIHFYL